MVVINAHRFGLYAIDSNSDQVFLGVPIPPGGRVLQVQGKCAVMPSARLKIEEVVAYGVKAFVMPVFDPDTQQTYDLLWDALVEKDQVGSSLLDLDTSATDTTPEEELGEWDLQDVLGINATRMVEVYERERLISYPTHPMNAHLDTSVHYFWPAEAFNIRVMKPVFVEQPAMLLFGFSSPAMDRTTTGLRSTPLEREWAQMTYMDDTISDMVKNAAGLTASGTQEAGVEAQAMLAELVEDSVIEETARANALLAVTWLLNIDATIQIEMNQPSPNRQIHGG